MASPMGEATRGTATRENHTGMVGKNLKATCTELHCNLPQEPAPALLPQEGQPLRLEVTTTTRLFLQTVLQRRSRGFGTYISHTAAPGRSQAPSCAAAPPGISAALQRSGHAWGGKGEPDQAGPRHTASPTAAARPRPRNPAERSPPGPGLTSPEGRPPPAHGAAPPPRAAMAAAILALRPPPRPGSSGGGGEAVAMAPPPRPACLKTTHAGGFRPRFATVG